MDLLDDLCLSDEDNPAPTYDGELCVPPMIDLRAGHVEPKREKEGTFRKVASTSDFLNTTSSEPDDGGTIYVDDPVASHVIHKASKPKKRERGYAQRGRKEKQDYDNADPKLLYNTVLELDNDGAIKVKDPTAPCLRMFVQVPKELLRREILRLYACYGANSKRNLYSVRFRFLICWICSYFLGI
jgi:hypothetical protein